MMQPARGTGADEFAVEFAVALLPFLEAGVGVGGQALFGLAQAVEGGEHGAFPVVVAQGDGLAQGLGFEQHAVFGDVAEVFERDRGDVKAALSLRDDQGIGDQQREGFAQGAGAHAVVVLEVFDPQAGAWRVHALDDVAAQVDVGRADQGVGGGGVSERGEGGAV
ncbi:hypothetical protein LMG6001_05844 [Achromobacter insolitus]|nr:hypothetical protein LMG6001_05844 [Achromobacter insolitus]